MAKKLTKRRIRPSPRGEAVNTHSPVGIRHNPIPYNRVQEMLEEQAKHLRKEPNLLEKHQEMLQQVLRLQENEERFLLELNAIRDALQTRRLELKAIDTALLAELDETRRKQQL